MPPTGNPGVALLSRPPYCELFATNIGRRAVASEKASRNGCDEVDLSALWPCTAQIGCIPITDMFARERTEPETARENR